MGQNLKFYRQSVILFCNSPVSLNFELFLPGGVFPHGDGDQDLKLKPALLRLYIHGPAVFFSGGLDASEPEAVVSGVLFGGLGPPIREMQIPLVAVFNFDAEKSLLLGDNQMDQPFFLVRNLADALDGIVQRISEQGADVNGAEKIQGVAVGHTGHLDAQGLAVQAFAGEHRIQHLVAGHVQRFIGLDLAFHLVQHAVAFLVSLTAQQRDLMLEIVVFLVYQIDAFLTALVGLILQVQKINAENVFVFPNNKNIILAAEQAKALVDNRTIHVIPTKNVPQGFAAALSFSPEASLEENKTNMIHALDNVKAGQVTHAVRTTNVNGFSITEGDIIGLDDKKILAKSNSIDETVLSLLEKLKEDQHEVITLYYGEGVTEEDAKALSEKVQEAFPDCDVDYHFGGQPVYYYLLSLE